MYTEHLNDFSLTSWLCPACVFRLLFFITHADTETNFVVELWSLKQKVSAFSVRHRWCGALKASKSVQRDLSLSKW